VIAVGSPAPPFEKTTAGGEVFRLSDWRGKKNVVLFFYPGDFTAVCTREACLFRDAESELADRDTVLVGVSKDDERSHEAFARKHALGYPLVSDQDHALAKAWGVRSGLSGVVGWRKRVTFVVDKQGIVRGVIHAEIDAQKHVDEVRRVLATLR
jgi:peroxiredoxin Q/BCP